jgi:hypothetical protein
MKRLPPVKGVKGGPAGCFNCGVAHDLLPLSTVLYYEFGGWTITCDGQSLYPPLTRASNFQDVRRHKDGSMNVPDHRLRHYERLAAKTRGRDWRATYDGPLHGETYQRQGKGRWVLVARNQGFA